ncbi:heat-inducible transcription repressor HrcA [Alicyclobacillaceae bacterium I2511]|nr:heat-inducible transcription repressor HrcA [Alicyclobacillaceae bacterium I2511]
MLTPRQQLILSVIVEDYVQSAEPVGSRTLSKHERFHLSSATIRNEMADLEELGFLDQPHASAGRIPSQKGYRYYVDHLTSEGRLDGETVLALQDLFRQRMDEWERVAHQTSVVLSQLTQYTTIVLGPHIHQERIKQIQLIPLGGAKAVAILVTDAGQVTSRQVQLSDDIPAEHVAGMVHLLNQRLTGTPLFRLGSRMYKELASEIGSVLEHYEDALLVLDELAKAASASQRVFVGGTTNILSQPEFRDVDKVKPLLEMLEQPDWVAAVLSLQPKAGVKVRIGLENGLPTLQSCTVISATYRVAGVPVGSVGIIGPTRMHYERVIRILDYTSQVLSRAMTERLSGKK